MVRKIIYIMCVLFCYSSLSVAEDHWDGEYYSENSEPQYRWAVKYIERLHLRGDEDVLDVGCGDGKVTSMFARTVKNGSVIGVDSSDSMIRKALAVQQQCGLPNLSFTLKDAMELDYKQQFDLVISFSCLHWVADHSAVLQGVEKALKPGGRAFLYFAPDHGRSRFDSAIFYTLALPQWKAYFENYFTPFYIVSPADFAKMLQENHLLFNQMSMVKTDTPFENKEAFMQWMRSFMPHLKILPEELHQQFLSDISDKYIDANPIGADGKVHYYDYFLEVDVEKPR